MRRITSFGQWATFAVLVGITVGIGGCGGESPRESASTSVVARSVPAQPGEVYLKSAAGGGGRGRRMAKFAVAPAPSASAPAGAGMMGMSSSTSASAVARRPAARGETVSLAKRRALAGKPAERDGYSLDPKDLKDLEARAPQLEPEKVASQAEAQVQLSEAEHNTEAYDKIVDNPFRRVGNDPLSTFSIDVDTASYSNVRRFSEPEYAPAQGRGPDRGDAQLLRLSRCTSFQ